MEGPGEKNDWLDAQIIRHRLRSKRTDQLRGPFAPECLDFVLCGQRLN